MSERREEGVLIPTLFQRERKSICMMRARLEE
jgi:hypothetical protein